MPAGVSIRPRKSQSASGVTGMTVAMPSFPVSTRPTPTRGTQPTVRFTRLTRTCSFPAEAKIAAFKAAGIGVAVTPSEMADTLLKMM